VEAKRGKKKGQGKAEEKKRKNVRRMKEICEENVESNRGTGTWEWGVLVDWYLRMKSTGRLMPKEEECW
jgi:hypothetical protein